MVDRPIAIAAAGGDGSTQCALELAARERRIDSGPGHSPGEVSGQDRPWDTLTTVARLASSAPAEPRTPRSFRHQWRKPWRTAGGRMSQPAAETRQSPV